MFERREDAAPAAVGHHRGRDGQQPVVGHEVGDARVRRHRERQVEAAGDPRRRDHDDVEVGERVGGKDVPRLTVPLPAEVGELRRGGRDEEVLDVDHDLGEALLPDQAGEGRGQVVLVEVGRGLPRHEPRPGGLHPGAERRPGVEPHVVAGVGEGPRDRGDRDDVPREGHRHEQESCRRCSRGWDGCGSAAVASQSAGHPGHQARPVPIAIGGPRRGAQSVATGESSAIAASSPARPGDSAISAPMRPAAPR